MNQNEIRNTRVSTFLLLSLLLFLGAGLRFYQLDRTLGGGDENQYLLDYADTSLKYIATTYFFGGHPVFHTLLMRLMIMGFDDETAIAIRFPAFIAGIASLWLIYRVALQLFNSFVIARLSLLIAVLCPIHIYYSQTARGYSLIMFFSIAMVYAAIKLMDSPQGGWGMLLALCGALSVYTVPTNVYFAASLAGWLCVALLVPRYAEELKETGVSPGKKALFFLAIFLLMALLSYLVYLPLVDQVIAESRNYHLAHEQETSKLMIAGRVPIDALKLIFPSPLMWFLPLLAVGVLFGDTVRPSYRLLPVCIFFLPLIVPLLTGVSGYARNYLYNLPILVIFLAAGIVRVGKLLNQRGIGMGIAIIYTLASLKIVFLEHYPAIKVPDGKLYKQILEKHTDPLDLILFAHPGNYLYAQDIFKSNMKNIFSLNKAGSIKIVMPNNTSLDDYAILSSLGEYLIFKNIFYRENLEPINLTGEKGLLTLTDKESVSILPDDFELIADWKIVFGKGNYSILSDSLIGKYSLQMISDASAPLIIEAPINKPINIDKTSLVVLVRSESVKKRKNISTIGGSHVLFKDRLSNIGYTPLRMGIVNDTIHLQMHKILSKGETQSWQGKVFLGIIEPGQYFFRLQLAIDPDESVLFDGFRIFVTEIPKKLERPMPR